ncbi:MAG: flagellar basal body P-ring formation chaperone FlgA [Planctomycetota bacterium]|nr:flagellar basal body P-ring formation chaperone FlgA [Planctomycetota bacterium]
MLLATFLLSFGGVTIQLPAKVEASGLSLRLGDVATVTGDDPVEVERIRAVNLGYVPAPGYSRLLHKGRLKQQIAPAAPEASVTFAGSTQCRVFPAVKVVTAETLRSRAQKAVEAKFKDTDVEISMTGSIKDITAPTGRDGVEVRARAATGPATQGLQGVAVDILVDGELWRTQWTTWSVATWEDVAVLKVRVQKGQKLTPDMFQIERRKRSQSSSQSALSLRKLQSAVAARELTPGTAIYPSDVSREKVVISGHRVQVEVQSGSVIARTGGVALSDGRVGDSIRIKIDLNSKELTGTVVAKNRILVELR